ncbi:MAG: putative Dual specificity protein kinase YAK1 [Streblomastix strix]|uniref:Putative Dual specificity protein kinase YAK1 n=1 Tax=Streblomastix strix TaxID=222440 RepID=A0A5J4WLJ5_9EUKA|nr:MAG: putative Dual specificity protein kinase YAK1 [Streblomastix strix]
MRTTVNLTELYSACSTKFNYHIHTKNFGTILTKPYIASTYPGNECDNAAGDLIVRVGDVISPNDASLVQGQEYVVEALLGRGSFGQVFRCVQRSSRGLYAVKIIKSQPQYSKQAIMEKTILQNLLEPIPNSQSTSFTSKQRNIGESNSQYASPQKHNAKEYEYKPIVRFIDSFYCRNHFCIVTELLGDDLYAILQQTKYRGVPLILIAEIMQQVLEALVILGEWKIIHSDLKPENILVNRTFPQVKLIDFGSAAYIGRTIYTYIQSRYYRAPEVLVGTQYSVHIDIWSLGCIAAELFLGRPIFPGYSEFDQIRRIMQMTSPFPSEMVFNGQNFNRNFIMIPKDNTKKSTNEGKNLLLSRNTSSQKYDDKYKGKQQNKDSKEDNFDYRIMTQEEYEKITHNTRQPKNYAYIKQTIKETINKYADVLEMKSLRNEEEEEDQEEEGIILWRERQKQREREKKQEMERDRLDYAFRQKFISFLEMLLQPDIKKRITAKDALQHPFINEGRKRSETKKQEEASNQRQYSFGGPRS